MNFIIVELRNYFQYLQADMIKRTFFIIIAFASFSCRAETKTAEVPFLDKKVPVFYDNSILVDFPYKPTDNGYFEAYYQRMDTTLYEILLKDIQAQKQELRLNDWLYFLLLRNSVNSILSGQKEHMRNLFLWFMLNKSGYETQLEFKGKEIALSVFTNDLVYGVPQSKGKGGFYIDLTSFSNEVDYTKWAPYRLKFNPNKGGQTIPFSFIITELPKVFESHLVEKEISFSHNGNKYKVVVPVDSGYVDFLTDYPELSVLKHTELALSPKAYQVLIPYLKEQTSGMDSMGTIRFLMSFCRSGFNTRKNEEKKSNQPYFGITGMRAISAPEESLFSKTVDSEDVSVLFYYLAKEILNPEMVLLKYGKQVSVAVYLHRKIGTPIMYNNKPYTLCDVSEDDDTPDIGDPPKSLAGKYPSFIEK